MPTYGVDEITEAIECMVDYQTSMGQRTRTFEQQFAEYVGAADAVMVNSGSSADLLLAYQLVNPMKPLLQPGDEVLVPVVTWPTQVWSVAMAGLKVQIGRRRSSNTECRSGRSEASHQLADEMFVRGAFDG